jgi:hypothetical protein
MKAEYVMAVKKERYDSLGGVGHADGCLPHCLRSPGLLDPPWASVLQASASAT